MKKVCYFWLVTGVLLVNAFFVHKLSGCPICVDENGHIKKPAVYAQDKESSDTLKSNN